VPFSFDLLLLERYWIERPAAYHHTAPVLGIYALHEALRLVLEEGLEARWARHAQAAAHLRAGLAARGLEVLASPGCQLAPLTAVRVPEGVDGKAVQGRLLREHGIEVGGGLAPDAPAMWRIGLMGRNASVETADRVLAALDAALDAKPAQVELTRA
jgi:alanine-glyoxylate transaminase / serine-glyoxylate transaminase / serine-pyruvate transaminase